MSEGTVAVSLQGSVIQSNLTAASESHQQNELLALQDFGKLEKILFSPQSKTQSQEALLQKQGEKKNVPPIFVPNSESTLQFSSSKSREFIRIIRPGAKFISNLTALIARINFQQYSEGGRVVISSPSGQL